MKKANERDIVRKNKSDLEKPSKIKRKYSENKR